MSFPDRSVRSKNCYMRDNLVGLILIGVAILGWWLIQPLVHPPNQPPISDFDYLTEIEGADIRAGMRVNFYDKSQDPEGAELVYYWDFGDGGRSSEKAPSHVFQKLGDYQVTLMVNDQEGAQGKQERVIRILPAGPIATFEASPPNPMTNNPVVFLDRSTHPAGNPIVKTTWTFDLAERETTVSRSGSGFQEQHVYSHPGTYKVMILVEDDQGLTDSCIREIVVSDLSTSIARLDQSIVELNTGIEELRLQIMEFGITLDSVSQAMVGLDKNVSEVIEEYEKKGMSALAWAGIIIALVLAIPGSIAFILQIIAWRRERQRP